MKIFLSALAVSLCLPALTPQVDDISAYEALADITTYEDLKAFTASIPECQLPNPSTPCKIITKRKPFNAKADSDRMFRLMEEAGIDETEIRPAITPPTEAQKKAFSLKTPRYHNLEASLKRHEMGLRYWQTRTATDEREGQTVDPDVLKGVQFHQRQIDRVREMLASEALKILTGAIEAYPKPLQ